MSTPDLRTIAAELNERSRTYSIGKIQEIRADLKKLRRRPGHEIFTPQTITDDYAFHLGGRHELQFNIGFEDDSGTHEFRHGVAFSFEPSQALPTPVDELSPKVKLFNDFMELYADSFADMRMWHFEKDRSADYMPGPIPWERVKRGVFVFLGKHRPALDQIDYEDILSDFDRLLPMYRYVEGGGALQPISTLAITPFVFVPGCSAKASAAAGNVAQRQIDICLRHNEMQEALYNHLISQYGEGNVGTENVSGVGTRVDVVVRQENEYWFYEIKTAQSPRACIREALGQLLEYSFWPGAQVASRLIVVGEAALDSDGSAYLECLKTRFGLPIDYKQISI
jgi:hypothetical protein